MLGSLCGWVFHCYDSLDGSLVTGSFVVRSFCGWIFLWLDLFVAGSFCGWIFFVTGSFVAKSF